MKAEFGQTIKKKHASTLIKEYITVIRFPFSAGRGTLYTSVECSLVHRTRMQSDNYGKEVAKIASLLSIEGLTCKEQVLRSESIYKEMEQTGKTLEELIANEV